MTVHPPGPLLRVFAGLLFVLGAVQIYGAGLLVFSGGPRYHPILGWMLVPLVLAQTLWIGLAHRRSRVVGPGAVAFASVIAAPWLALAGPRWGGEIAALHPLVGIALLLAQAEVVRRLRPPG